MADAAALDQQLEEIGAQLDWVRDDAPRRGRDCASYAGLASIAGMADAAALQEQLEEIGAQLDWVRDYL